MFKRKSSAKRSNKRVGKIGRNSKRVVRHGGERYRMVGDALPNTFPGGNTIIRNFRRFALDSSIYGTGGGVVAFNLATAAAPPYLTLSATTNDIATSPTLGELGVSYQAAFTDIEGFARLTNLFNEFQLSKIELHFSMDNAPSYTQGNGGLPNAIPSVYIATDDNDAAVPPTQASVVERGDCEYHQLSKPFTYTFYPKPAIQLYSGTVAGAYAAPKDSKDLWLDVTTSSGVPHYGVKMWWRNFQYAAAAGLVVRVQPIYFVKMRMTR